MHPTLRIEVFPGEHQPRVEMVRGEIERLRAGEGVQDYLALNSSGKVVAGPFKHYDQAAAVAKAEGGYVKFAMEVDVAADYVAVSSSGKPLGPAHKSYADAKAEADRAGGYVKFSAEAGESPLDAVTSGLQTVSALRGGAADFDSMRAAVDHERAEGATHTIEIRGVTYILWPDPNARGPHRYLGRALYYSHGKYHVERRAEPVTAVDAVQIGKRLAAADRGRRRAKETAEVACERKKPSSRKKPAARKPAAREGAPALPVPPTIECKMSDTGLRSALAASKKLGPIRDAKDVHRVLWPKLGGVRQEVFGVLLFDVRNQCIGWSEVAKGPIDHVEVPLTKIHGLVVKFEPHHYLVVHNHPSGKADPSRSDATLTHEIEQGSRPWARESAFVDHVILGLDQCYSFRDLTLYEKKGGRWVGRKFPPPKK